MGESEVSSSRPKQKIETSGEKVKMPHKEDKKIEGFGGLDFNKPPAITLNMLREIHEKQQELAKERD